MLTTSAANVMRIFIKEKLIVWVFNAFRESMSEMQQAGLVSWHVLVVYVRYII